MDRLPPQNLDAEMAVIGAIMVDRSLYDDLADLVHPEDFYAHINELIFRAIVALLDAQKPVDKITVCEELRRRGILDKVGGPSYLSQILDTVQTAASARYYAEIVAEKARCRRIIEAGRKIIDLGFAELGDVASEAALALSFAVEARHGASDGMSSADAAKAAYEAVERANAGKGAPVIMTPFPMLNKHIRGLRQDVVTIAAEPGVGKSVVATQFAHHAAVTTGKTAVICALEMGREDTFLRLIASQSGLDFGAMRTGSLRGAQWERFSEALADASALPLWFCGSNPPKSVSDIRRIVRRLHNDGGVSMVVVDHPGYLQEAMRRQKGVSKHEALTEAYSALTYIADELEIPVVIVQHLNRSAAGREPTLSDLRDGGNLEGVSSIVLFPLRDVVNSPDVGQFLIAKNRHGSTGRIPMRFDGERYLWLPDNSSSAFDAVA